MSKRELIFLILLVFLGSHAACGSPASVDSFASKNSHSWLDAPSSDLGWPYWRGYLFDSRDLVTGFIGWHAGEWITASLAVGSVAGLYVGGDKPIREWIQRNRTPTTDTAASWLKLLGDGRYALPALGGSYLYGWIFSDQRARDAARFGGESFLLAGAITGILKYASHRHRPWDNQGPYMWDGPGLAGDDESFPSGHTTTAFSIAGAIAGVYHDNIGVPIIAYTIATLVGLARMNDDAHWASDVLAGALIGTVAARTVVTAERHEASRRVSLSSATVNGHPGLSLSIAF